MTSLGPTGSPAYTHPYIFRCHAVAQQPQQLGRPETITLDPCNPSVRLLVTHFTV